MSLTQAQLSEGLTALWAGIADGSIYTNPTIRHSIHPEWPELVLFSYGPLAAQTWTPLECVCRGIIVNVATKQIVARPFDKFFNWGERGLLTTAPIEAVSTKYDGSLCTLYRTPDGQIALASRGSFTSEQAIKGTEHWRKHYRHVYISGEITLMFELVAPWNQIVIRYPEERLILIGARNHVTGKYWSNTKLKVYAVQEGLPHAEPFIADSVNELIRVVEQLPSQEEGYVVRFTDGQFFKFKGLEYFKAHKLISHLTPEKIRECLRDGTGLEFLSQLPDEYRALADDYIAHWQKYFRATWLLLRDIVRNMPDLPTQKDYALWVLEHHKRYSSFLFALKQGKSIDRMIWEHIKVHEYQYTAKGEGDE